MSSFSWVHVPFAVGGLGHRQRFALKERGRPPKRIEQVSGRAGAAKLLLSLKGGDGAVGPAVSRGGGREVASNRTHAPKRSAQITRRIGIVELVLSLKQDSIGHGASQVRRVAGLSYSSIEDRREVPSR
jgi:hypothetical protein